MREIDPNGRYCMLLRKSREDIEAERHGQFETLEYHEADLRRLADQLGIKISKVYRELVSGDRLDERPQTQELVREVMRGQWDGVLAVDPQRITRGDLIDQGTIINAFKYSGTVVITPRKIFRLSDTYDEHDFETSLRDGRRELGWIKDRLVAGKARRSRDGQYLGSIAPFGWRKVVEDRKRTLEPDENHDVLYQMYQDIYHWRRTPSALADWLNNHGVTTQRDGNWDGKTVTAVIRNEVNIGYIRWNQRKSTIVFDEDLRRKKVRKRPDEGDPDGVILARGLHMGRGKITRELFEGACRQLDMHAGSKEHSGKPLQNPLARLLVCANCGRVMARAIIPGNRGPGRRGKTEWYVHPRSNRHLCSTMSAPMKAVVLMVADALEDIVANIEVSIEPAAELDDRAAEGMIRRAEKLIAESRRAIDNLFRLVEKGMISDEEFGARKKAAEDRIADMEDELERLHRLKERPYELKERAFGIRQAIGMLREYEGRAKEVNTALGEIVEKITYERDPQTKEIHLGVILRD